MSFVREARGDFASDLARSRRRLAIPLSYQSFSPLVAIFDFVWIIVVSIGTGTSYQLAIMGSPGDLAHHLGCGMAVAVLFGMSARAYDLYRPSNLLSMRSKIRTTVLIWVMVFFCLTAVAFTLKVSQVFSRGAVILFFVAGIVGIVGSRAGIAHVLARLMSSGALSGRRVVLLTDSGGRTQSELVMTFRPYGYNVLQVFDVAAAEIDGGQADRTPECVREVLRYVRQHCVDEVFLAVAWSRTALIDAISAELRALPSPVKLLPDPLVARFLERPLEELGPAKAIELQRAPLTVLQRAVKRTIDIMAAGLGLGLLAPVFAFAALAIRLDSRGPIFFVQRRVGFNGHPFRIYKLRTMTTQDDGAVIRQACRNDVRVTRVGRILRRFSLDELPQLLNVLRGEMSLVGPRPHALAHDNAYDQLIASYAMRQKMKPGITGWAQVNGCRGETPRVDMMKRRVDHDLRYIDSWSLWLDIQILAMTVLQVFKARQAY
jgi:putative colanic acid biosynthesis UDP-glucose lipid carrier transferase